MKTDLAHVEADEQQINLTRFSLFFPEKREFFLENQGTFTFGGFAPPANSDVPTIFYSRRIGLDRGRAVPIVAGGRVTGRLGRFSIGGISIRSDDVPAAGSRETDFSVLRIKRDVFRRSSVGVLATDRSVGQGASGSERVRTTGKI